MEEQGRTKPQNHNTPAPKGSGRSFKTVTTAFNPAGGSQRLPALVQIDPNGPIRTTTELTELMMTNLKEFPGLTRENMKMRFGVDADTGEIAMYLAARGPFLHKIRDWGSNLGCHMGSVFREHPHLRPTTSIECDVELDWDVENKACFVFNIFQGLAKKAEPVPGGRPKPEAKIKRKRKSKAETGGETKPGDVAAGENQ